MRSQISRRLVDYFGLSSKILTFSESSVQEKWNSSPFPTHFNTNWCAPSQYLPSTKNVHLLRQNSAIMTSRRATMTATSPGSTYLKLEKKLLKNSVKLSTPALRGGKLLGLRLGRRCSLCLPSRVYFWQCVGMDMFW